MTEAKKEVHRHLPGKYHSEPNVAAILLGRVDLRVDRQQFRNHMKILDSLCAVSRVSLSRIGNGRRGGRPSQETEANTVASGLIPRSFRGWAILLGRVDLRVDRQQFRNNMKIQDSLCAVSRVSLSCIGNGRRGGRPSQETEANTVASGLIPRFCRGWAILLGRVDLRVDRQQFRNHMKIQDSRCAVSRVSLSCIGTGRRGGRPSQETEAKPPFIYAFPANRR